MFCLKILCVCTWKDIDKTRISVNILAGPWFRTEANAGKLGTEKPFFGTHVDDSISSWRVLAGAAMMAADARDASCIDIGYVSKKANQSFIDFYFSLLFMDNIWLCIDRRLI